MAENSGISWTDNTFNPWIGCTKVSPACDFCYAEVWDEKNGGSRWGPRAARTRTGVKNWNKVLRWNRIAAENDKRTIVFCASLADVFDNHASIDVSWRDDLWSLIRETKSLSWMLLTKRPGNIVRFLPPDWGEGYANVALGVSAENAAETARRIPVLMSVPAACRFLSMEPLLERVDLDPSVLGDGKISYVIAGGESGAGARPSRPDWFRAVRDACQNASVGFHFKQWGEFGPNGARTGVDENGSDLDGVSWKARLPIAC